MRIYVKQIDKYNSEYTFDYHKYRFAYICFKRNRRLETIIRFMANLHDITKCGESYHNKVDIFIKSFFGLDEIVLENTILHCKKEGIYKIKGYAIKGVYNDILHLKPKDTYIILAKPFLEYENIDIWRYRISSDKQ